VSEPSPPTPPERLVVAGADVVGVRAANPGPLSLSGTNSWIVGRDPAWLVDPGPELTDHLDAIDAELDLRGGLGGIAATHDHIDHVEALGAMRDRHPGVAVAAARGEVDVVLIDGAHFGPLEALATPGHAPDHLAFALGDAVLTGDAVLGEGSVFIAPGPGALGSYLAALHRLAARRPRVLLPGHGPVVLDAQAKLAQYIAHRLERERALLAALGAGRRSVDELLDAAWADAPAQLRPVAAVTLAAHLDKLEEEGRLPGGVERPELPF
jgi:glyoxylase-like metal-dependent hydrolase (beta-lactamase superfamily II)